MYYWEELAAFVLTGGLGLVFLLRPTTIYHYVVYLYLGADTGRGGHWGADPQPSDRVRLTIRVVGIVLLLVAFALILSPWWRDAVF